MRISWLCVFLVVLTPPVFADSFTLSLGKVSIGSLDVTADSLQSSITQSPMGLADGAFTASATPVRTTSGPAVQYLSNAPAKGRTISVIFAQGAVAETIVVPSADRTDLSDPAVVPAGVVHPLAAFQHLLTATECPDEVRFYDGRRVIALSPDGASAASDQVVCTMQYQVTHGPGHVSPLFISRARMDLTYAMDAGQRLVEIKLQSGPFTLYARR